MHGLPQIEAYELLTTLLLIWLGNLQRQMRLLRAVSLG